MCKSPVQPVPDSLTRLLTEISIQIGDCAPEAGRYKIKTSLKKGPALKRLNAHVIQMQRQKAPLSASTRDNV